MLSALHERIPECTVFTSPDAHEFMRWLKTNIESVNLICLDHDLDSPNDDPGRDMGDGRDVAKWLTSQSIKVPVLIHTSNGRFGAEMESILQEAEWPVYWSPLYEDLVWIRKSLIK
jgi:hypothetical protein